MRVSMCMACAWHVYGMCMACAWHVPAVASAHSTRTCTPSCTAAAQPCSSTTTSKPASAAGVQPSTRSWLGTSPYSAAISDSSSKPHRVASASAASASASTASGSASASTPEASARGLHPCSDGDFIRRARASVDQRCFACARPARHTTRSMRRACARSRQTRGAGRARGRRDARRRVWVGVSVGVVSMRRRGSSRSSTAGGAVRTPGSIRPGRA